MKDDPLVERREGRLGMQTHQVEVPQVALRTVASDGPERWPTAAGAPPVPRLTAVAG